MLSSDEPSEVVVAVENYMPKDPSSLGFSEGQRAMVLEKAGGWWFVRIGEEEGWVPGGFFEPLVCLFIYTTHPFAVRPPAFMAGDVSICSYWWGSSSTTTAISPVFSSCGTEAFHRP